MDYVPQRTRDSVARNITVVASWDSESITLDTGGWSTVTTKLRMNQTSNHFGLGFHVYQKNHEWYVDYRGVTYPFEGDTIHLVREVNP